MKIVVIVQARTSSTRLPGKVMKDLLGKPVLIRQLDRISASKNVDEIIVATTKESNDNIIVECCKSENYKYFRGDLYDLLDRHYKAAISVDADIVIKIPSDCPLIDPLVIDKVIQYYLEHKGKFDFVSNLHPASYPDGNDVEVMSIDTLRYAWSEAEKSYELEHTTPYIWDNPHKFRIGNIIWETGLDYSRSHRFTLDYIEDYEFIKAVYNELFPLNPLFGLNDILRLLDDKPELMLINNKYAGEYWYRNVTGELKTISNLSYQQQYITI